jgi:AraC family transcriptional regulator
MLQVNDTGGSVLAEVRTTLSIAQLVRFDGFGTSLTSLPTAEWFRVDMGITPRAVNTCGCYRDHWNAHRFDPLGQVFVVPPGERLRVRSDGSAPHTSIVCDLHPELLGAGSEYGLDIGSEQLEASLNLNHRYIQSLLFRLSGEVGQPQFATERFVEHLTAQLGIEIARCFARALDTKAHSGGLAPWRLRLIDERVARPGNPPTLTELADTCKLSVRQLTRAFKITRGCSVGDYIAENRIDQAKRLLMANHDIRSVAAKLGYSSSASFSAAFRRVTGSNPRAFRQRAPRSLGPRSDLV